MSNSILKELIDIIDNETGVISSMPNLVVNADTSLAMLGVDSLDVLYIQNELETKFNVSFSQKEGLYTFATIGNIVDYITTHSRDAAVAKPTVVQVQPAPAPKSNAVKNKILNMIKNKSSEIKFTKLPHRQTYDITMRKHHIVMDSLPHENVNIVCWNGMQEFHATNGVPAGDYAAIRELLAACAKRTKNTKSK